MTKKDQHGNVLISFFIAWVIVKICPRRLTEIMQEETAIGERREADTVRFLCGYISHRA